MKFAGVGPRTTPPYVLESMSEIGKTLSSKNHKLVSGHGYGADQAWAKDVSPLMKTIYIPWAGFNGATANPCYKVVLCTEPLMTIAAKHHPAWDKLTIGVKKLMARNVAILLGNDLNNPVDYVLYWQDAKVNKYAGGTGHTLRMADNYNIPNFNIGNSDEQRAFEQFLLEQS